MLGAAETTIGVDSQWERVQVGPTAAYRNIATPDSPFSPPAGQRPARLTDQVPSQGGHLPTISTAASVAAVPPRGGVS